MFKRFKQPRLLLLLGTLVATSGLLAAQPAAAVAILLGKTTAGGIGVYYNTTGSENPDNQAFLAAQFDFNLDGSGNGAGFQFDNTDLDPDTPGEQSFNSSFSGLPFGSSQFGFDFVLEAPTSDGSRTLPTLDVFDHTEGSFTSRANAGPADWGLNDYKNFSPSGPGTPGNTIVNSSLRGGNGDGNAIVLSSFTLSQVGSVFTADIAGQLISDGLIHWYNPASGSGTLNSRGFQNTFLFEGKLTYDSAGDDGTDRVNFYTGSVSLFAQTVPEPGTLMLLALGLAVLGLGKGREWVSPSRESLPASAIDNPPV